MEAPNQRKAGRPFKRPEERRSSRLQMRTFPDIVEKVARVGTEAVEAAIRRIEEPKLSGELVNQTKFDLQKAIDGAPVRCREQHYTPSIERPAGTNSNYALVGSVSSNAGMMKICWNSDGTAVRLSKNIFTDSPDTDFDLLMAPIDIS